MQMQRRFAAPLLAILCLAEVASAQGIPPGVQIIPDLQYGRFGASSTLDLYLPRKARTRTPVIIWIHGGGWEAGNGSKEPWPGISMVDRGFAVASINYRVSDEAIYPAQIYDCKAAVRWLRSNAKRYNIVSNGLGGYHFFGEVGTTPK